LASYGQLAAAIAPFFISACVPDLIRSFFTDYLTKSKELMAHRIVEVLTGWINVLDKIEQSLLQVAGAAESLITHLGTVPDKVRAVEKKVCKADDCLGAVISSYMEKSEFSKIKHPFLIDGC